MRTQNNELEAQPNEWEAMCADLKKFQYHSEQQSRGSGVASSSAELEQPMVQAYGPSIIQQQTYTIVAAKEQRPERVREESKVL